MKIYAKRRSLDTRGVMIQLRYSLYNIGFSNTDL